ncbi:hypothetical protein SAMN05428987_3883 [Paenibacillus sp. CF095]|nr:hypothetical protein SAMN05428987_3883 [Paenibacillus sp. CF095]
MILNLLIESLKERRRRTIWIALQCTVSYVLIILILSLNSNTQELSTSVQNAASTLYKVNDHYFDEQERDFLAQSDHLQTLNDLYEWEKNNPLFKYIVASKQHLFLDVQDLPAKFQYGYEAGQETPDAYESIQVNQAFMDHFSIRTHQGSIFRAGDYDINNTIIPIVAGYEYKDYLQLGQILDVGYMGIDLKCKVIGILEKHSFYNDGYSLKYLDRVVMLPSFEAEDIYAHDGTFMLRLLWDKTSGYIHSSLSANSIQELFTKKSLQLDMEPYVVEGVSNFYLTMWGLEGEQLQQVFIIFAFVIGVTTLFSLSTSIAAKISLRQFTYGVMIANGVSRLVINLSILLEIFLVNTVSLLMAFLLSYVMIKSISIPTLLLFSIILSVISFIPSWITINHLQLSKTIRGGNQ